MLSYIAYMDPMGMNEKSRDFNGEETITKYMNNYNHK